MEEEQARDAGALPDVPVVFDVSYTLQLLRAKHDVPSVARSLLKLVKLPFLLPLRALNPEAYAARRVYSLHALRAKGVLKPGTFTLLLSPAGGGQTTLLKALTGQLQREATQAQLAGTSVTWAGLTAEQLAARGVNLRLLASFTDQMDAHLPLLTVRETAQFAYDTSCCGPAASSKGDDGAQAGSTRVDDVLQLLRLDGCANTRVGDATTRGISGGERRRLSLAEALLTNARLICLDEPSTGLDASVTYDILAALREKTRKGRLTTLAALQQPTPEVYGLFDDVILLREGCTLYHGPRQQLPDYLRSIGYDAPADGCAVDIADWLDTWLTTPHELLPAAAPPPGDEAGAAKASPPTTVAELAAAWEASELFASQKAESALVAAAGGGINLHSDFLKRQFGAPYARPAMALLMLVTRRHWRNSCRNTLFLAVRLITAFAISLVVGSLWLDLPLDAAAAKYSMLFYICMTTAFVNMGEQPFVVSNKRVAYKQLAAGMYSPLSYALAHTIVQAPLSFIETAVTSLIAYPMVGLVLDGGRWVYFFFVLWLLNMANGSLLRVFAYAARTLEEAQTAPAGFVALQVLFSGFMIAVKLMGWMKFLYYVSLLGYSLHALAINEFQAPKYTELLQPVSAALAAAHFAAHPQDAALPMSQLCAAGAFPCASASTLILQALSLSARPGWRYAEVGFLVGGVLIVCNLLGGAIMSLPVVTNVGASRAQPPAEKERDETESAAIAAPAPAAVAVAIAPAAPVALPFTPMTVVWRDLCYAVTLRDGSSKQLLHGITGVALPGRCQALMGPSGGGKTTLLDVLSGRKNVGVVTGDIHLNGFPSNKKTFARLMAYGEQQDAHTAQATVGESLLFAAALRLERRITPAQRTAFCDEVLALLRLDSLRHRIVGEPGSTDGLGGAERKMLTIAVELASNAPILFLDEPTTSLDPLAAARVMRAVSNVAATGRTVICTVHAPSAALFDAFHDVTLLQRGGWHAFFGARSELEAHLSSVPGAAPRPAGMNVASWMLDVLAGTDSSSDKPQSEQAELDGQTTQAHLHASEHWKAVTALADMHATLAPGAVAVTFRSRYPRRQGTQLRLVLTRKWLIYTRNVSYNATRIVRQLGLVLLFGVAYYQIAAAPVEDEAGVQSLVALLFTSALFLAMLNVLITIPVIIGQRGVLYRERASHMYSPEVHAASCALIELPWVALMALATVPIMYFMADLNPAPEFFFYFAFTIAVFTYALVCLAQAIAALSPSTDAATSATSLFLGLLFQFGGLLIAYPEIPHWWRWLYRLNPLSYALVSLAGPQFVPRHAHCTPGLDCPTVAVLRAGAGYVQVDTQACVSDRFGIAYDERWPCLGYLALFALGFQAVHFAATRFITHATR